MDEPPRPPSRNASDDATGFFRAVAVDGKRHGIRLERAFWSTLDLLSREAGRTIPDIIRELEAAHPDAANLTALLRVKSVNWLSGELGRLREATSPARIRGLVLANPSPTFSLSESRKIHAVNPPFLAYLRSHFAMRGAEAGADAFRLQLDINPTELIARLQQTETYVQVGFVIGFEERRVRGRINALLAPCWSEHLIIGHVIE